MERFFTNNYNTFTKKFNKLNDNVDKINIIYNNKENIAMETAINTATDTSYQLNNTKNHIIESYNLDANYFNDKLISVN